MTTMNEEQKQAFLASLRKKINRPLALYLDICAHCGLCADACHLYKATGDVEQIPAFRADQLRKLYKRHFTILGRYLPRLVGAEDLSVEAMERFQRLAYQCTACRRCTLYCPFGIDNASFVSAMRALLSEVGMVPAGIQEAADNSLAKGNTMGLTSEQYLDRIEWLEEELQDELDDDDLTIPLDKVGARCLFIPTPLQLMKFPSVILSTAKIFRAAGEDWTMSSRVFDATNFGLFAGDSQAATTLAGRLAEEVERLEAEMLVLPECGHAYWVMKKAAETWLKRQLPFTVKSIIEVVADFVSEGRLKLDPSVNAEPVTYHDPCNLGRKGGLLDEPRLALRAAVTDFREMTPSGEQTWCCGGGSGVIAVQEWDQIRLAIGQPKADQIRGTGARVVATACDNCKLQLLDFDEHYDLDVRVTGVVDLVANALVMENNDQ